MGVRGRCPKAWRLPDLGRDAPGIHAWASPHSWVCLGSFPSTQSLFSPQASSWVLCPCFLTGSHCPGLSVCTVCVLAPVNMATWSLWAGSQAAGAAASVAGSCSPTPSAAWPQLPGPDREGLARPLFLHFPDLRPLYLPLQPWSWARTPGRGSSQEM